MRAGYGKFGDERGISLIAMAFVILIIGLFAAAGTRLYDTYNVYRTAAETDEKMEAIQTALVRYFAHNGRYPCPAALDAPIDDPTGRYGVEVTSNCAGSATPEAGTFRAAGRDGRTVRTGAVPVRTLGLPDSFLIDGYNRRLVYAVTESYAVAGETMRGDNGGIFIIDGNDQPATGTPGNVVQIVYSMGWDNNGSYLASGQQAAPCDPAAPLSGENCNFDTDAVFRNSVNKSTRDDSLFVHKISYQPSRTARDCVDNNSGVGLPKDTVFLIDTSGSMGWSEGEGNDGFNVKCPTSMPGCSRIDVARWAMRRVMPAVIQQNTKIDEAGKSSLTGFLASGATVSTFSVDAQLASTDIGYFHPDELDEDHDLDGTINRDDPDYISHKSQQLDTEINGMCPVGGTPLGVHIKSLADQLGNGTSTRPNKITIISDGLSNDGDGDGTGGKFDPVAAANYIKDTYPNVQVDIVDIVGNPSLMAVSQLTGGKYYRSDNPDALLKSLASSLGVCESQTVAPPVDQQGCGSKGGWW